MASVVRRREPARVHELRGDAGDDGRLLGFGFKGKPDTMGPRVE
ncbi:MAG: hypothetical protein R2834_14050 [Rhodothermales bacterium]